MKGRTGYPSGLDVGSLMAPIAEDQWIESHHLGKVSQKLLLVFYDAQLIFISFSTSRSILKDCEEYQNEEWLKLRFGKWRILLVRFCSGKVSINICWTFSYLPSNRAPLIWWRKFRIEVVVEGWGVVYIIPHTNGNELILSAKFWLERDQSLPSLQRRE